MANRLRGHALKKIYSYDSVSHLTHADCECGWGGNFRSNYRAREAHKEHKRLLSSEQNPHAQPDPQRGQR